MKKWPYLSSEALHEKSEDTFRNQLLILETFCFLTRKDPLQIKRDMANLTFSLSEKDATNHETKAGMQISQCKMTNWPYLAQFASDLFGSKNKKFLKSKKVSSDFSFKASELRYGHFFTKSVKKFFQNC